MKHLIAILMGLRERTAVAGRCPLSLARHPTNNPAIENDGGIAICLAANGVEVRYRAVRNFEIGGWVLSSSGSPCADYNVRNS